MTSEKIVHSLMLKLDISAVEADLEQLSAAKDEVVELTKLIPEPTLEQKVSAAAYVLGHGGSVGRRTQATLMWPEMRFSEAEVLSQAAALMAYMQTALLQSLPADVLAKIWKDQNDRLMFVHDSR